MGLLRKRDPLDDIERGALDPSSDLTTLLRRCIALGGRTESTELREWASFELKGHGAGHDVPDYRKYVAPLLLDGFTGRGRITGQVVSADMIPDDMSDALRDDLEFRQPISQLMDLRKRVSRDPHGAGLAPPGM